MCDNYLSSNDSAKHTDALAGQSGAGELLS